MTYDEMLEEARADERELVTVERLGDRAIVRMSDPTNLNALSAPLTLQLQTAFAELTAEPQLRSVVLTGEDPGFSAGGDLELMLSTHDAIDEGPEGTTMAWRWIRGIHAQASLTLASSAAAYRQLKDHSVAGVTLWEQDVDGERFTPARIGDPIDHTSPARPG